MSGTTGVLQRSAERTRPGEGSRRWALPRRARRLLCWLTGHPGFVYTRAIFRGRAVLRFECIRCEAGVL